MNFATETLATQADGGSKAGSPASVVHGPKSPRICRAGTAKCAIFVGLIAASVASAALATEASEFRQRDPDARAAAVEAHMSDAERLQLLHGVMVLPVSGLPPPPEHVKATAGYVPGIPRLGIPDLLETDGSLGVGNPMQLRAGDVATALPAGLALAASFDVPLARRAGATIGAEARAKGFNVLLAGSVNLIRDPRNGRNFEYLAEDPLLAGTLAGAEIAGIQSQGVVSTVKHFALNDQETLRQTLDARIEEAGLRESDLLAFNLAIEAGQPGAVMCAYNKVNGEPACGNGWLLNEVLRQDWKYPGWVMSDWGAVHDTSYLLKGLDQQSGAQLDEKVWFGEPLKQALADRRISRRQVSASVRRILRSLYAVGADHSSSETAIDYGAHARVAREIAEEGMVLLKNEGALPLASPKRVLVIGGHADIGVLSGGGSSQVTPSGGSPMLIPVGGSGVMAPFRLQLYMPSSPLAALRRALPASEIEYDSGYDVTGAAAAARHADLAIVFATQWQSEGSDVASMDLPEGQNALIAAVAAANPNTLVVLETGNPVKMPWLSQVKAVLESWYPGEQGGEAIAAVLAGTVNPSGHLPMSFARDESQLARADIPGLGLPEGSAARIDYTEGALVGYRWYAARSLEPLFPFGYGLSYTTFKSGDLEVRASTAITARFTVENSGMRAGSTVTQVYLTEAAGHPARRLVAFSRVNLQPGEIRSVELTLDPRLLAHWQNHRWEVSAGRYAFALGSSAADLGAVHSVDLKAQALPVQQGAPVEHGDAARLSGSAARCTALIRHPPSWPDPTSRIVEALWRPVGSSTRLQSGQSVSLPAHCEITAMMRPRVGIDGQHYAIRFHLRLPLNWNQRFYFEGGGGTEGELGTAVGMISQGIPTAIERGYAVVSQDSGHSNATNSIPERGGVVAFGFDPQARENYGGAALKPVAAAAKVLIESFYGHLPEHSYFVGCSKGGQEGMASAQRYPELFDGIVAGAPGFSLPRAALAELWDTQAFASLLQPPGSGGLDPKRLPTSFSQKQFALVRDAVLAVCDADDGVRDGMTAAFGSCTWPRVAPELKRRQCSGAETRDCLSEAQINVLARVYAGPKNSAGKPLYSDWPFDAGIGSEGWRIWKIGPAESDFPGINIDMGAPSAAAVFTTPPTVLPADTQAALNYALQFDFDRDAQKIDATDSTFKHSAWTDISARSPDLTEFRRRGGRLIVPHGVSDAVFSVNDTIAWYREVNELNHGEASDFVRVFPVPGMNHCFGGPATDQFDAFDALVKWVEEGSAPNRILANAGSQSPWPGRSRPLCPYPKVARYRGTGSAEDAASFQCE